MKALIKGNIQHHMEETFWSAFLDDLRTAQSLVIIACPYIRPSRLHKLRDELQSLRDRGVQVCAFLQDPASWSGDGEFDDDFAPPENPQQSIEQFNELVVKLQSKNVHVMLRRLSHQKIVIIDGRIVWFGSLNVLSNTGTTHENMTRIDCPETAQWKADAHRLHCPQCKQKFSTPMVWFGKQFEKCREQAGFTQETLAPRIKVDQSNISKIERGERDLAIDTLIQYANAIPAYVRFVPQTMAFTKAPPQLDDEMTRATICAELRRQRRALGISCSTVGDEVGLSRKAVESIEKGLYNSQISVLTKIAAVLGMTLILTPYDA